MLNEEKYISHCLDSVLSSDYPLDKMEILLIDGMSSDKTREIIKKYQKRHSVIKLLDNPKKIVPVAMNIGIIEAKGEYIIRLDAHASYPKNYFSTLIKWHQKLDADNIGTPIHTEVKNRTEKSLAIKTVLSHKFGVGDSTFRTGIKKQKEVDTVPFGCYPRGIFEKYGYYDERLIRNQDIELNKRIAQGGGKIYLIPDTTCTYYARESFIPLAKNNYANGLWNILTAYYTHTFESLSLRHFVPLLFVLSLIVPLILSSSYTPLLWLSFLSLVSYLALVIIISLKTSHSFMNFIYTVGGFFTLHLAYGIGSVIGIVKVFKKYIKGQS
jgi:glycosyltransferase involved in cell wall biosynthesis